MSVERYGIPGVVLMENAARAAADVACQMAPRGLVVVVCGGGNNGGDGLAMARHLHNRGWEAVIALAADPAKYQHEARANWEIISAMKLPAIQAEEMGKFRPSLVADAIFGTGLTQSPRPPFAALVAAIHGFGCPILAIDIPSGLDCDTGKPLGPCVRATRTVTFVAEKAGFAAAEARPFLGEVTVGDIGCPVELISEVIQNCPGAV